MGEPTDLADGVRAGDRRALARAITLVESTRADHRDEAVELLDALLPSTGGATRVGISGAPGAGKTVIIRQLELEGFSVVEEAATDVIAAAQARGIAQPWANPSFIDDVAKLHRNREVHSAAALGEGVASGGARGMAAGAKGGKGGGITVNIQPGALVINAAGATIDETALANAFERLLASQGLGLAGA